jgi:hypothetical protein
VTDDHPRVFAGQDAHTSGTWHGVNAFNRVVGILQALSGSLVDDHTSSTPRVFVAMIKLRRLMEVHQIISK